MAERTPDLDGLFLELKPLVVDGTNGLGKEAGTSGMSWQRSLNS